MAQEEIKASQLPIVVSLSDTDSIIAVKGVGNTAQLVQIKISDLKTVLGIT